MSRFIPLAATIHLRSDWTLRLWALLILFFVSSHPLSAEENWLTDGEFEWTVSRPLISPMQRTGDLSYSIKDPTVVFFEGKWRLFCTIRSQKRSHQIEYLSFADWENPDDADRCILTFCDGYFCAPQVFYFTPQNQWFMIFQTTDESRKPALQPAYSTSTDIDDPFSWSEPVLLFEHHLDNVTMWIDFWVICDDRKAHLFFTSLDGRMWRSDTDLEKFPHGWRRPNVVLQDDIFEAGHIYRIENQKKYLAVIEAKRKGRRYYKAYISDVLEGQWRPLAATHDHPFASPVNVKDGAKHWTDSFSHGEMLRIGCDEKMTIDPYNCRFLFQGVSDVNKAGKKYGEIPWRLGLLKPVPRHSGK